MSNDAAIGTARKLASVEGIPCGISSGAPTPYGPGRRVGQPAGQRGQWQFRAPKTGLRMISRSVAPEFDVIDRGMAALLD